MILGVCQWLSGKLNVDVTVIRIIFVVLLLAFGTGLLLYLVLWLVKAFSN